MEPVVLAVLALAALFGLFVGVRHLWLRVSDRNGFECGLRVTEGSVAGLTHRFRQGYARRVPGGFEWTRILWPGDRVGFRKVDVRFQQESRPSARDRALWIPPAWIVLPVEPDDGTRLELTAHRRVVLRLLTSPE